MADPKKPAAPVAPFTPQAVGKPVEYERLLWQTRFSPRGDWLIGVGQDAKIVRWKVAAPTEENQWALEAKESLLGHNGWITGLQFHPEKDRLFTTDSWGQLACYAYQDEMPQEPIWSKPTAHEGWIRALAIDPDGEWIATAGNDRTLRLWSTENGAAVREWPHTATIMSLAFSPDRKSLVSGDLFGKICQWDVGSGEKLREIDASVLYGLSDNQQCGGVRKLVFDEKGERLAAVGQKDPTGGFATGIPCVLVFDWAKGELIREMPVGDKNDGFAYDAFFHPAGFIMACSSAFPGKGPLWLWRPEEEQAFAVEKKLTNGLSLALHPDGKRIAFLIANSPNGNGRSLKDGEYPGGSSRIQLLALADPA